MDTNAVFFSKPETTAERAEFYERLETKHAGPLWQVLGDLVLPYPQPSCVPAIWRYEEMRPFVMESGEVISAVEAERRVLILQNPGLKGLPQITQSLYAGLQLVLPGEVTPSHRHAASALRFIIEGSGAYTSVNGEKVTMHPGDFILTPSWTWHDHGNLTGEPVVWLDGLDIPIVNTLDASFAEHYPDGTHEVTHDSAEGSTIGFPFAQMKEKLLAMHAAGETDACHGARAQYRTMPTIAAWLAYLPAGFEGAVYRSSDATVFCAAEGSGRSRIGDVTLEWKAKDVFVVPSWSPVSHHPDGEAVLFSFSDKPVQQALGLWREKHS